MHITKTDVIWNYIAAFVKIGGSVLLLPLILRQMLSEMVSIWMIFATITAFGNILDFGFNSSFARNITYVFSGVRTLNKTGFEEVRTENPEINYGLLKGVIKAMKGFYLAISLLLIAILSTCGTYYIHAVLNGYSGDKNEVYFAWALLCFINTFNIYTLYYDSLLVGAGMVGRSKQICVIGNLAYLGIAAIMICMGKGLIAIVSAQAVSVVIIRILSRRAFYTKTMRKSIATAVPYDSKEILKAIYPNAVKVGITSIGGLMLQRSMIIIGSIYLSLDCIASYGVTMQITMVVSSMANVFIMTNVPQIFNYTVNGRQDLIKPLYIKGQVIAAVFYIVSWLAIVFAGNECLHLIGSKTPLLDRGFLTIAFFLSFEETIISMTSNILLAKNEVPFFKAAILSGVANVLMLVLLFKFTQLGILTLFIVPLVVDFSYQAWKWPLEVAKLLHVKCNDYIRYVKLVFSN